MHQTKYFNIINEKGLFYIIFGDGLIDINTVCKTFDDFHNLEEQVKGIILYTCKSVMNYYYSIDLARYVYGLNNDLDTLKAFCHTLDNYIDTIYLKDVEFWKGIIND